MSLVCRFCPPVFRHLHHSDDRSLSLVHRHYSDCPTFVSCAFRNQGEEADSLIKAKPKGKAPAKGKGKGKAKAR